MDSVDVLIVGAGPSGLMLAGWLAHSGIHAMVVDLKGGPTDETRAVGIQARTLELWDRMGITERVLPQGRIAEGLTLWANGKRVARAPVDKMGEGLSPYPYIFMMGQDRTERILLSHLASLGGEVAWHTELTGLAQDEQGCIATLMHAGAQHKVRARFVCGCDGARSAVRKALGIEFPGGTYEHVFYVADVHAEGGLAEGDVNVATFDRRFLAFFPLREEHRYRFVGILPETVTQADADPEDVIPEAQRLMHTQISDVRWFSTYRVHHRVASHFQQGRVFLVGDAGHVHSPVGAQGMNTGLQDAANLAWKLVEVVKNGADERLLATYEEERIPFARGLVGTTDRAFQTIISRSVFARLVRRVVLPFVFPLLLRLGFVRRFIFGVISQTRLFYDGSAISEGPGAGQRMPWIPNRYKGERADRWSLHLFGPEPPQAEAWAKAHDMGIANWPNEPPQAVLVRPDGYIGYSSPTFDPGALEEYLRTHIGRP